MAEQAQQPVIFLSEGTKRTRGRDAQRINIMVAKAVANAVRSTLGPKGMDKMIVDELGDITISNDGATILKEMSIDHPAGKMMVEVAKTQDDEVGDGTTTAVIFGGTLLSKAESLLDDEIHPSIIVKGYRLAAEKARQLYTDIADDIKFEDVKTLKEIALTSMTGKASEGAEELSNLVVQAVRQVAEKEGDRMVIERDNIKLEKKVGANLHESQLIKGIIVDKEIVHAGMPKKIQNAKIALVDSALEIKSTEVDAKIQISDPEQLQAFLDQEEKMLKNMVDKIVASGANVLFCQKGIDDVAQHYLSKRGITAARRVKKSDMEKLVRATGGRIVTTLEDLGGKDLGHAGLVEERKIAGEQMVFVEKCKDPKSVTLLVRGGTQHVVDEAERALVDAIGAVRSAIEEGKYVTGGGSTEMALAMRLRKHAVEVGGREQLAIQAFADALEVIPRSLADSCGLDSIDALVDLRSKHEKRNVTLGVDVYKTRIHDMAALGIIEPLRVKKQAIQSASEAAEMILRIDDIIASKGRAPMPAGGGAGGMGGGDF